jgi:lactoylglutathione lyase
VRQGQVSSLTWPFFFAIRNLARMAERAFPVIYAQQPAATAAFYERLGFERHVQLPPEGEPGYIGLRRGTFEVSVVDAQWTKDMFDETAATGKQSPRFEMFVYVDDVERTVEELGAPVLKGPEDMPWGERIAYVADPDGNPVALSRTLG